MACLGVPDAAAASLAALILRAEEEDRPRRLLVPDEMGVTQEAAEATDGDRRPPPAPEAEPDPPPTWPLLLALTSHDSFPRLCEMPVEHSLPLLPRPSTEEELEAARQEVVRADEEEALSPCTREEEADGEKSGVEGERGTDMLDKEEASSGDTKTRSRRTRSVRALFFPPPFQKERGF